MPAGAGDGEGGSATGNASAVSASGARSVSGTVNTVQTTTGSVNTVISNESASSATSGDGEGLGLRSQVVATSNQYVGISAPGANEAVGQNYHLRSTSTPAGYSEINTGAAMTQPTPTPIPRRTCLTGPGATRAPRRRRGAAR